MRNTFFDASEWRDGLNAAYDPTLTHFTYLEDSEITSAPNEYWLAQKGENLHVTFQNATRTTVTHYFYNKSQNSWRVHRRQNSPWPYAKTGQNKTHENLKAIQARAIEFAWPNGVFLKVKGVPQESKKDKRLRQKEAQDAKKQRNLQAMEDVLGPKKNVSRPGLLKPVRFPQPPTGRITEDYVNNLIKQGDRDSLEYIYLSDDWPLAKWDSTAWSTYLFWLTGS